MNMSSPNYGHVNKDHEYNILEFNYSIQQNDKYIFFIDQKYNKYTTKSGFRNISALCSRNHLKLLIFWHIPVKAEYSIFPLFN